MTELDRGNPRDLAARYRGLVALHPHITVLGGCCGTDLENISEVAASCTTAA